MNSADARRAHDAWLFRFVTHELHKLDSKQLDLVRYEMLWWSGHEKRATSYSPEMIAPTLRREWREKLGLSLFQAEDFMPPDVAVKAAVQRAIGARRPSLYDRDASEAVREMQAGVRHLLEQLCNDAQAVHLFAGRILVKRQADGTITREVRLGPDEQFYEEAIRVCVALGQLLRRCKRQDCSHPFAARREDQRYCTPRCREADYSREHLDKRTAQKKKSRETRKAAARAAAAAALGDAQPIPPAT